MLDSMSDLRLNLRSGKWFVAIHTTQIPGTNWHPRLAKPRQGSMANGQDQTSQAKIRYDTTMQDKTIRNNTRQDKTIQVIAWAPTHSD